MNFEKFLAYDLLVKFKRLTASIWLGTLLKHSRLTLRITKGCIKLIMEETRTLLTALGCSIFTRAKKEGGNCDGRSYISNGKI